MRTHLQGIALLGFLVAALWGVARLASPTLREAFGEDGAVVAQSGEDTVDLVRDTVADTPLTPEQLTRLQFNLLRAGFLEELAQVDGTWGPTTRGAMEQAAQAWGLDRPSDREMFDHADELFRDKPFLTGS